MGRPARCLALLAGAAGLALSWLALRPVPRPHRLVEGRTAPASDADGAASPLSAAGSDDSSEPRTPRASAAAPEARAAQRPAARAPEPPWRFRLEGRVIDRGEQPFAGAVLRSEDEDELAVSDAHGLLRAEIELARDAPGVYQAFSFEGGISTARLLVTAEGMRTALCEARIVPDGVAHLGSVVLEPGGEARGTVLVAPRAPLAGARVDCLGSEHFPRDEGARAWLRSYGPGDLPRVPGRVTDEGGGFRLEGLPLGEVFLVASAPGRECVWSDPFRLVAGVPAERTLVLGARRTTAVLVAGRVLDSRRDGLADARVQIAADAADAAREGLDALGYAGEVGAPLAELHTDRDGRFAVAVELQDPASARLWISASDPELRGYPAVLEAVAATGGPFELVLPAPRALRLRLLGPEGEPARWSHVTFAGTPGDESVAVGLQPLGAGGEGEFLRPLEPFSVQATGPGYRAETFGPFDPAALGPEVVLTLARGEAVLGRVVAAGTPVAGARLGLHRVPPSGRLASTSLAPLDLPFTAAGALSLQRHDGTSDSAGRFTLSLHADGPHVLTVEAPGWPWTVFGPFRWDRATGAEGLELELLAAGAIEGRVLVPPGRPPEGRLVGASSGWNVAFTASADALGRYRIENLAPGRYQVRPCLPPAASRQAFDLRDQADLEPAFDCQVFPGATTTHDLDLRDEEDFVLSGSFGFDRLPVWNVLLRRDYQPPAPAPPPIAWTTTSADGGFELRMRTGGSVQLLLERKGLSFIRALELAPGVTEWHAEPAAGLLRLPDLAEGLRSRGLAWASFRWRSEDGLEFRRVQWPGLSGTELAPFTVPAGKVELWGHSMKQGVLLLAEPLAEIEVPAGEERALTLLGRR